MAHSSADRSALIAPSLRLVAATRWTATTTRAWVWIVHQTILQDRLRVERPHSALAPFFGCAADKVGAALRPLVQAGLISYSPGANAWRDSRPRVSVIIVIPAGVEAMAQAEPAERPKRSALAPEEVERKETDRAKAREKAAAAKAKRDADATAKRNEPSPDVGAREVHWSDPLKIAAGDPWYAGPTTPGWVPVSSHRAAEEQWAAMQAAERATAALPEPEPAPETTPEPEPAPAPAPEPIAPLSADEQQRDDETYLATVRAAARSERRLAEKRAVARRKRA